jgi:membrane-associated HD superfamily phosphohydrolase
MVEPENKPETANNEATGQDIVNAEQDAEEVRKDWAAKTQERKDAADSVIVKYTIKLHTTQQKAADIKKLLAKKVRERIEDFGSGDEPDEEQTAEDIANMKDDEKDEKAD